MLVQEGNEEGWEGRTKAAWAALKRTAAAAPAAAAVVAAKLFNGLLRRDALVLVDMLVFVWWSGTRREGAERRVRLDLVLRACVLWKARW